MFRPTKPSQTPQDSQAYIPPHIESAMAEHMQRSLPTHLKKYQGGGTYVPEHVENEMTQHLENTLPEHMKQYAGTYLQQRVVQPSLEKAGAIRSAPPQAEEPAPTAYTSPQDVSGQAGASTQPPVPGQTPTVSGPQASYTAADNPNQNQPADQSYAFITTPEPVAAQSLLTRIPGGNSLAVRIGLIAGGLVVLVIIFSILKSALSSSPDLTSLVTVVQDQQELIHLATNANEQHNLTTSVQNSVATLQLTLTSSQSSALTYLANNHKKVSPKQLNLKVSDTTDSQLTEAAAATTYNQTFQEIVKTKLTAYSSDLQQAYQQDKGKKGRALLSDSYQQAKLLQVQLAAPTN